MAESPAEEFVWIKHPNHGPGGAFGGPVTRAAFDEVLALEGWEVVDPALVRASGLVGRQVNDLKDLTELEIKALALSTGVPVDDRAKPAELTKAVTKALTAEQTEVSA